MNTWLLLFVPTNSISYGVVTYTIMSLAYQLQEHFKVVIWPCDTTSLLILFAGAFPNHMTHHFEWMNTNTHNTSDSSIRLKFKSSKYTLVKISVVPIAIF